jgi:hypothetical protein
LVILRHLTEQNTKIALVWEDPLHKRGALYDEVSEGRTDEEMEGLVHCWVPSFLLLLILFLEN